MTNDESLNDVSMGGNFSPSTAGRKFKFSTAISLAVNYETQGEVDNLWDKLSAEGGKTLN